MTPLVIPHPSVAAYDAYVTYTQDEGIGYVNPLDVELWLPLPDGEPGGMCIVIDAEGSPPVPGSGVHLAHQLLALEGLERALVKVHGVPTPGWAVELYLEVLAELGGRLPTDLLAVEGYRWESWVLSRGLAAAG
jgi:hypothetical protein